MSGAPGLLLVDKPTGPTSHDVVGRVRRLLGTRRVGHAGTLDPLASGLVIVGVERATRLLGHLALKDKTYLATIRLGVATSTDDAQGEPVAEHDASSLDDSRISDEVRSLTGAQLQVPSSVSAIKVDGRRAYQRVRAGESVELAARRVVVSQFEIVETRRGDRTVDLDVEVSCSTGTYVRALARDLGTALGVGGHLTALRRTRIGGFSVDASVDVFATDDGTAVQQRIMPVGAVAASIFATRTASADEARELSYGRSLDAAGISGTYAVLDDTGEELLALVEERDGRARPVLVWQPAG